MIMFDTTRGEDSTGIAFKRARVGQPPKTTLLKTEGIPYKLYAKFPEVFDSTGSFEQENYYNFSWVMGHNRSKTIGAVNSKNAHPFHHGNIVGAHNGTITVGLNKLPTSTEIKGDTDSERIIYALSKGMSLKEIVENLKGAIALSWYDSATNTYHLFRNKERTLWYYINPMNSTVLYASEAWMIKMAVAKSKLVLNNVEPIALLDDQHISFDLNQKDIVLTKEIVSRPLEVTHQHNSNHYKGQDYYNGGSASSGSHSRKVKTPPNYFKANLENNGDNIVDFSSIKPVTGWLTLDMTEGEFNHYAKYGCVVCGADLDYAEHTAKKVFWLEKDSPFCETCANTFKTPESKVG